jgi:hypothetical protein
MNNDAEQIDMDNGHIFFRVVFYLLGRKAGAALIISPAQGSCNRCI